MRSSKTATSRRRRSVARPLLHEAEWLSALKSPKKLAKFLAVYSAEIERQTKQLHEARVSLSELANALNSFFERMDTFEAQQKTLGETLHADVEAAHESLRGRVEKVRLQLVGFRNTVEKNQATHEQMMFGPPRGAKKEHGAS